MLLPLPLAGLGAFEAALGFLYTRVSAGVQVSQSQGLIVALAYRVITIANASVGFVIYMSSGRDVEKAYHDAEVEAEAEG